MLNRRSVIPRLSACYRLLPCLFVLGMLSGCASDEPKVNPNAPKVTKVAPVTSTGREAAVLNVNLRKEFPDACLFGITVTNNLPYKITNMSYRVVAFINGDVFHSQVTRNFFEIKPTEQQYRDVIFHQITCSQIDRLEIRDPGRCSLGKLNRFSTDPGDCAKFTDVAPSSLVDVVKQR